MTKKNTQLKMIEFMVFGKHYYWVYKLNHPVIKRLNEYAKNGLLEAIIGKNNFTDESIGYAIYAIMKDMFLTDTEYYSWLFDESTFYKKSFPPDHVMHVLSMLINI